MDEISLSGTIYKYTNVLFGYQKRYFKLRRGTIYYYLSKEVETEGCRKFRVLKNFRLEFDHDPCRLDICFPDDDRWFLKFNNEEEKTLWQNALESFLSNEKQYQIVQTEQRRESIRSLPADHHQLELASKKLVRTTVIETRHANNNGPLNGFSAFDQTDLHKLGTLKSQLPEQFTNVMRVLSHVVDTRGAPLDLALVEQTCERCKHVVDAMKYLQSMLPQIQVVEAEDALNVLLQENYLSDEEWFDATTNGPLSDDQQIKDSLKISSMSAQKHSNDSEKQTSLVAQTLNEAPIFDEIRRITSEQLNYALSGVDEGVWELFVKDGEMRMYKMEKEVEGVMCDPLKAVHSVNGVTAREFIDIFFDPKLKKEWDDTLVRASVVDRLADDTVVLHQLHKRVWPAAQRESLFWSNRQELTVEMLDEDAHSGFMVCNKDCERDDVPLTDSSCVRVGLTIAMVCQTLIENRQKSADNLVRDDVKCKIVYVAQVHPGGWLPTAALRQVYKREYPKFLRQFSAYVQKKVKDKSLEL